MHVFIANFCNTTTLEAEQDDPDFDLERMASPQFFSISASFTEAWVDSLKVSVLSEMDELYDEDEDEDHKHELSWKTDGWKAPKNEREHQTWRAYIDGDLMTLLIVQKEECLS